MIKKKNTSNNNKNKNNNKNNNNNNNSLIAVSIFTLDECSLAKSIGQKVSKYSYSSSAHNRGVVSFYHEYN